jgi:hypothetical protein
MRLVLVLAVMLLSTLSPALAQSAGGAVAVDLPRQTSSAPALEIVTPAGRVSLSLADLESLPLHRVTTATFWPDDDGTYEGPLMADVLRRAGIDGAAALRLTARDGFSQVIPRQDWMRWPLLLATRRDGKPMSIRQKGPLRVIYPRDSDKELTDPVYRLRWVWLLKSIEPVTP